MQGKASCTRYLTCWLSGQTSAIGNIATKFVVLFSVGYVIAYWNFVVQSSCQTYLLSEWDEYGHSQRMSNVIVFHTSRGIEDIT